MNISYIIKQEFLRKVKSKPYLILTFLGPLIFVGAITLIFYLTNNNEKTYKIKVVDDTKLMFPEMSRFIKLYNTSIDWTYEENSNYFDAIKEIKSEDSKYDILLFIPKNIFETNNNSTVLIYNDMPNQKIEYEIKELINNARESVMIDKFKIDRKLYASVKTIVNMSIIDESTINNNGEKIENKADYKVAAGIGLVIGGILLFMIMYFGTQVMRSVIAEKTSRVIEILVSSIKPINLLLAKIIGVSLASIMQFVVWVIFSIILMYFVFNIFDIEIGNPDNVSNMSKELLQENTEKIEIQNDVFNILMGINWVKVISFSLIFMILGYFFYTSIFAAIGSAVESETETQQFVFPVTMPLMIGFYTAQFSAFSNPNSSSIKVMSYIPFTSPICMMQRIVMDTAKWYEILISILLLLITIYIILQISAKIYRVGILTYGKKASLKQMIKWLKFNEK